MLKIAVLFVAFVLFALSVHAAEISEKIWRIGQPEQGLIAYCIDRNSAEEVAREEVVNGVGGVLIMLVLQVQLQQCFTANVEFIPVMVLSQHTSPVSDIRVVAIRINGTTHYLLTRRKIVDEPI